MYNNRDISWLSFNHRVLMEAADKNVPLLERLRFLSIFSSNLDEFFRVRFPLISVYANLNDRLRKKIIPPPDKELAAKVQVMVDTQLDHFGHIIHDELIPDLEKEKIILYYNKAIPAIFTEELRDYFYSKILSFIQPVFIRTSLSADFFPESNRQYLLITLQHEGAEMLTHAFINIPAEKLGRFHSLQDADGFQHVFFIDDILRQNLGIIFSNHIVKSCYSFKITRDADLHLDEENVKGSLLAEIEKKLIKRENGLPSRLLFENGMPLAMQHMMAAAFGLTENQLFEGGRYHNLFDLANIPVHRSDLCFPKLQSLKHREINGCSDVFSKIDTTDLLFHFPYQSYNPVLSFFNQAAIDPDVESIYITLYRVAADSFIANALISAAKNKKEVTVFVELKARFDEANNIRWSKAMKKAGVKILYSIPGIKVHSKIALIKKKKEAGGKKYAFIGTGNFNETTARFYTDHALLTSNAALTKDLEILFSSLSKGEKPEKKSGNTFEQLLVSQNNMTERFEQEINQQIKNKRKGLPAYVRLKLNNLEDVEMIDLLYKASAAGVPVDLIVRSVCCIMPGRQGLSENIRAKRIVDRFLEHSRIFIFGSGDHKKVFIGSADWMTRNLRKRVEVITPVLNKNIADELEYYFDTQWNDTVKADDLNEYGEPVKNITHSDIAESNEGLNGSELHVATENGYTNGTYPQANKSAQNQIYFHLKNQQHVQREEIPG